MLELRGVSWRNEAPGIALHHPDQRPAHQECRRACKSIGDKSNLSVVRHPLSTNHGLWIPELTIATSPFSPYPIACK
jgi:hypothetical protein